MKITVHQNNLKKAILMVDKIVSRNPSLPILNNVLIKTENGRLRITATNLEIGINYYIGAKIDETGEIAIPARIISDFIATIGEEKITLIAKNNILYINTEKYKTHILGFDPKDFPIIPKIKGNLFSIVPAKILKNSLLTVLESVAISDTRPELAGVFISFTDNHLTFASTDSFRLTEKVLDLKNKETSSCILPRNTTTELIRITSDIDGDLNIKLGDNQISFFNDDIEILSRIVDGSYPDYKKVIPEKYISKVLVKKYDLERNVRLAGLFSSSIADIKLNCSENSLQITGKNSDKGEIQVVLDAVLNNEPFDISLNHHYLLDGLKVISTDNVVIEYTGQGGPLALKPENSKDLVYLIMPLRS